MNEKTFIEIFDDSIAHLLKKYIPLFRIPGLGDKWIEQIKTSMPIQYLHQIWSTMSLM